MSLNRMYEENRKSLNWFVGCRHNCIYCEPSFQRQMKRQKRHCILCYQFLPHPHLERLRKPPPKTGPNEFIFAPSSADPVFCRPDWFLEFLSYAAKYPDTYFLTQSKNPKRCFDAWKHMPENVLLGTTIETNLVAFHTPSDYKRYEEISKAPFPFDRVMQLDIVTVEPILDFELEHMISMIRECNPKIVYVGYDNWKCGLPEPCIKKTLSLIEELNKFAEVRQKTIRKAWWES